jgi:(p)ppGpp synthase/HD superfamily hydrolase
MTSPAICALARGLAIAAHAGQRYGDQPYTMHLLAVRDVLLELAPDRFDLLAAAWLHDVLEDTVETKQSLLDKGIPIYVVQLVDACTDGPGRIRAIRKQRPFALIPQTTDSVLVKLADRIANTENAAREGKAGLLEMYRGEHDVFRRHLRVAPATINAGPLWERLERVLGTDGGAES